jgi:tRNA (guanine37-N1)-methyltransferase
MNFVVLTIFPEMIHSYGQYSILKRAVDKNLVSITALNIRDFAEGKHRCVDDRPYGGGAGMVLKPEPITRAVRAAKQASPESMTILLTPQGRIFNQRMAQALARCSGLIMVCGRYEGVDERICDGSIDLEISTGDYILTGGELAAMMIIDAVTRLVPGTLGGEGSAEKESFSENRLEHAHYTRPRCFEKKAVPDVLLSGNHKEIEQWRLETSLARTFIKRRDLLDNRLLDENEINILKKWYRDIERILRAQSAHGADSLPGVE